MPTIITAKDNNKVKYTKSLLKTKNRNKESKFIIEGYRILTLAVECKASLDYVFINEDFENKEEHLKFLDTLKTNNIKIYKTTNKIFNELIDTENTQGILGVVNFKQRNIEEYLKDEHKFVLILDRIQDPGNMGTIIRTADAAGVDAIIALKGCVDIYNPKVIRSTMGSIFDMNIIHATQEEALRILKLKNFDIVSSYLNTNNYYNTVEYNYKTALVIGNEANGINDELVSKSDMLVKIPIYGNAESLNAAISSAILMYEIKKYLV
ncbi:MULTISPECIES: TrmH family RNA methyltransferase [Romboutsia]|uniref:23S rRNA methyltransferase n=1 Tax=Romboutsia hominis TaxID=1507512 RepID=A0A2P2BUK4_9FIRM|nr:MULTISPECIES: RNA methyltransferase [Romboutsia]MDB8789524.1 RNA methyltransferase [Romboutsia sp. 1001216sp1]MDB8793866.1 RNA methyltransferase [Romboutsia sp. 1001216sp1]MDB8796675.1 RNA methyltransferase [Romboutsia sp. 1001216sp1]MDB8799880.1 RNA methyltransferase [Romboutsia sp. 1001216sp1]MDB8802667.1 RNA methyltransferase [Romboutsia sp. 1001216sp1]